MDGSSSHHQMSLFDYTVWNPLGYLDIHAPYLYINAETVWSTWIVLIVLTVILLCLRRYLYKKNSLIRFVAVLFIRSWKDTCKQTLGSMFTHERFALVTSLFIFILSCNWISVLPL